MIRLTKRNNIVNCREKPLDDRDVRLINMLPVFYREDKNNMLCCLNFINNMVITHPKGKLSLMITDRLFLASASGIVFAITHLQKRLYLTIIIVCFINVNQITKRGISYE